jgi:hypothetical protein
MKRIKAIALFTAASTLAVANALAQDYAVKANIPFDFAVHSKVLPAGTYQITQVRDDLITIQDSNKNVAVLSASVPDDNQSLKRPALVFDKFGSDYFLREVLGGSAGALNVSIPLSRVEERVRTQESMARNMTQVSIPTSEGY